MLSLSLIIPTRNEGHNIGQLLQGVHDALRTYDPALRYEILVVDDSTDNTVSVARQNGARVVKGQGKGLGQAIIDGIKEARHDVVLVMDADGSHQTSAVPSLLKPILQHGTDLVIGSRYVKGGDYSEWSLDRKIKSLVGVKLMQLATGVRDSNSGYFAFRKSIVDPSKLNPKTWKIMLEVLFKGNWISKLEVPIVFVDRIAGVSKRSTNQVIRDAINLVRLVGYRYGRFINFALVGGIGAIWYFVLLWVLTEYAGWWYGLSAIIATLVAVTNNYLFNHYWTFRHVKENNKSLFKGWLKYIGNAAIGDGADWVVMVFLTEAFGVWYMLSAFIASGIAAVIKYTIAKKWIWGGKGRRASDADYEWVSFHKGLIWQKRWKRILASIVKEYAEYPTGDAGMVLDYGCGSSPAGVLVNHKDYIGLERNMEKVQYMQSKDMKDCRFACGTLDDVSFTTFTDQRPFDTIIFAEVIEHLEIKQAKRYLIKMSGLLKPNGKLVVATPNFGGLMGRWMDTLYGIFQKGAYRDEHKLKFSLESLKGLCAECGLQYVTSRIPSGADMVVLFRKV